MVICHAKNPDAIPDLCGSELAREGVSTVAIIIA
jgi:hypothetical protein